MHDDESIGEEIQETLILVSSVNSHSGDIGWIEKTVSKQIHVLSERGDLVTGKSWTNPLDKISMITLDINEINLIFEEESMADFRNFNVFSILA